MQRNALSSALAVLPIALLVAGCGADAIPPPDDAIRTYAEAARRGDSKAIHAMLSESARNRFTQAEVDRMVADQRAELSEQAKSLVAPGLRVETHATVRFADGELASLAVEDGGYRVSAADGLPSAPRTVPEALSQLRRALARRSYAGLYRVLTPRTRAAIEEDLRSLVEGLEAPEGLEVRTTSDTAEVVVPGGHLVRLRRDGGVWHVEDFD